MDIEEDKHLNKLLSVLEKFPGLEVSFSNHGRDEHSKLWREKYGSNIHLDFIRVSLAPPQHKISSDAYSSIEWLAWVVYKAALKGDRICPDLEFRPFAAAPHLNGPGECLSFILEGTVQNPDELATKLDEMYQQYFSPA